MDERGKDRYRRRLIDPLLDELASQLSGLMIVGPRGAGKTTTAERRANTVVHLDRKVESAAFRADPDVALKGLKEPILLDEWQAVPEVFAAARRAIDRQASPSRFYLTGSVMAEYRFDVYPGTGRIQRLALYPMTVRELEGRVEGDTFLDRIARGHPISLPAHIPDLRGYIDLALASGYPVPAMHLTGRSHETWLEDYVESLINRDLEQFGAEGPGRRRDLEKVRKYFEASALNTAGVIDQSRIHQAASVSKQTGGSYEQLLSRLMVIDQVPGWRSNRLKRLTSQPKRYLIDPSLAGALLRLDAGAVLADGDMLGRILDTFVMAQLRPETAISRFRPRIYHLRTKGGRQEIDLLVELAGQKLIGIEVKASAAPDRSDARHLAWLRDQVGDRFIAGVVLHTGPRTYQLDEKIMAAPIAGLWG
ncbi:MAG: DUF4143 domain-containing protein [Solirubrobacterales bacterium]|nr:DUF4143 domain-containing protein [Solirubrobacterales bacterium]